MSFLFVSTISGFGSVFSDSTELFLGVTSVGATGVVVAAGLPPNRRKRRRRICIEWKTNILRGNQT